MVARPPGYAARSLNIVTYFSSYGVNGGDGHVHELTALITSLKGAGQRSIKDDTCMSGIFTTSLMVKS